MARWARCSTRKGVFINQCYDELNAARAGVRARRASGVREGGCRAASRRTASAPTGSSSRSTGWRITSRSSTARAAELRARGSWRPTRSSRAPSARSACGSSRSARRAARRRARSSASRWQALVDGGADLLPPRDVHRPRRDRAGHSRRRARSTLAMPVIAQMTIGPDGLTPYGAPPRGRSRARSTSGART